MRRSRVRDNRRLRRQRGPWIALVALALCLLPSIAAAEVRNPRPSLRVAGGDGRLADASGAAVGLSFGAHVPFHQLRWGADGAANLFFEPRLRYVTLLTGGGHMFSADMGLGYDFFFAAFALHGSLAHVIDGRSYPTLGMGATIMPGGVLFFRVDVAVDGAPRNVVVVGGIDLLGLSWFVDKLKKPPSPDAPTR